MFQQTIQDALTLAEAGPGPEELLTRVAGAIRAFEKFEGAEIVAETPAGLRRFTAAPGLGELGAEILDVLGEEPTFRIDTAADLEARGLVAKSGFASLLALRLQAPGATRAAIVLGHSRAWSFAAAPLSRIRNVGSMALRLLLRSELPPPPPEEVKALRAEVARLRGQVAALENEIVALRAERAIRKTSDTPR